MRKAVIATDLFRGVQLGLPSVRLNSVWLSALFGQQLNALGFDVEVVDQLDIKGYFQSAEFPLSADGWALAASTRIKPIHHRFFASLFSADLVIAWGLPPSLMSLLHEVGVCFVDVEIDPIRFSNDLFFSIRTNDPVLSGRLQEMDVPESLFSADAALMRGFASRRDPSFLEPQPSFALFAGQTGVDLALVENGTIRRPSQFMEQIRQVAAGADKPFSRTASIRARPVRSRTSCGPDRKCRIYVGEYLSDLV